MVPVGVCVLRPQSSRSPTDQLPPSLINKITTKRFEFMFNKMAPAFKPVPFLLIDELGQSIHFRNNRSAEGGGSVNIVKMRRCWVRHPLPT
jgi:hypothetical protein